MSHKLQLQGNSFQKWHSCHHASHKEDCGAEKKLKDIREVGGITVGQVVVQVIGDIVRANTW